MIAVPSGATCGIGTPDHVMANEVTNAITVAAGPVCNRCTYRPPAHARVVQCGGKGVTPQCGGGEVERPPVAVVKGPDGY